MFLLFPHVDPGYLNYKLSWCWIIRLYSYLCQRPFIAPTLHESKYRYFNFQSETLGYFGVSCDTPCRPSSFGLRCAVNCSLLLSPWFFLCHWEHMWQKQLIQVRNNCLIGWVFLFTLWFLYLQCSFSSCRSTIFFKPEIQVNQILLLLPEQERD